MKSLLLIALTTALSTSGFLVRTANKPEPIASASSAALAPSQEKMKAFRSERELARYFAALAEKRRREEARRAAKAQREAERRARREAKPSGDTGGCCSTRSFRAERHGNGGVLGGGGVCHQYSTRGR